MSLAEIDSGEARQRRQNSSTPRRKRMSPSKATILLSLGLEVELTMLKGVVCLAAKRRFARHRHTRQKKLRCTICGLEYEVSEKQRPTLLRGVDLVQIPRQIAITDEVEPTEDEDLLELGIDANF